MTYALQNRLREKYARELDALGRRQRSRLDDPRAAMLVPRGLEKWERVARGEAAQRVIDWVLREKRWAPDSRLDQWVERVYCSATGMNMPAGAAGAEPLGPLDVLSGSSIVGYLQGELGITIATGVSAWASQISGTTLNMAQATTTRQPVYTANDATIWARSTVTSDGVDDTMASGWTFPAPGTTPSFIRCVANRVTDIVNGTLFGGNSNLVCRCLRGSATQIRNNDANNGPLVTMTVNTWYRTEHLFVNSTSDYLKVGANTGTGTDTGNNTSSAWRLFGVSGAATSPGNYALQKLLVCNANPTALQKALLDGIDSSFYNGNISL